MTAQDRDELAQAVNTVEGINCTPNYRSLAKAGDACVRLARKAAADNGFGFVSTWQIWIATPQDNASAEKWLDDHHDEIAAALDREWVATTVTPAQLVFDSAVINGVIYEGTR